MSKGGSKKKNTGKKVLIVLAVIFVGYLILAYMNYFPFPYLNSATAYPNSTYLASFDFDTVSSIIEEESNTLSIIEGLQENVEIKIYGINGKTIDEVYTYLVTKTEQEGWQTYSYGNGNGNTWRYNYHVCTKGAMAMGHVVVSGEKVEELTNYNVVYATVITDQITLNRIAGRYR